MYENTPTYERVYKPEGKYCMHTAGENGTVSLLRSIRVVRIVFAPKF